jgi:RNA polymerase sigma-70 factor (ECF subfamily)
MAEQELSISKSIEFADLDALKSGDIAEWNAAFRHLWPMALHAARHPAACLVPWEAEDVASEAILELMREIESVTSISQAKALVITIAYRRAISLARRKSAAKRIVPVFDANDARGRPEPSRPTEFEHREMIFLFREALDGLDPLTRVILMEKIELELTHEEISERYGLPLGTVCTKIARGLKKLRTRLEEDPRRMEELREYLR